MIWTKRGTVRHHLSGTHLPDDGRDGVALVGDEEARHLPPIQQQQQQQKVRRSMRQGVLPRQKAKVRRSTRHGVLPQDNNKTGGGEISDGSSGGEVFGRASEAGPRFPRPSLPSFSSLPSRSGFFRATKETDAERRRGGRKVYHGTECTMDYHCDTLASPISRHATMTDTKKTSTPHHAEMISVACLEQNPTNINTAILNNTSMPYHAKTTCRRVPARVHGTMGIYQTHHSRHQWNPGPARDHPRA